MVQKYIIASSNLGYVISRPIATSTAKALISCNPGYAGQIDLESFSWAQSVFRRMGLVRRRGTMAKFEILDGCCSLTISCLRWIQHPRFLDHQHRSNTNKICPCQPINSSKEEFQSCRN